MRGYKIYYYVDKKGKAPARDFIANLDKASRVKIHKYMCYLEARGVEMRGLYTKHIQGKIWELRIDFSRNRYRILYFIYVERKIIFLHAFVKKTQKTPRREISKAIKYYNNYINRKKYG